jgi:hypothetical protein
MRVPLAVVAVALAGGCAGPSSVSPWHEAERAVAPEAFAPGGLLVVETEDGWGNGDDVDHRHPFSLYDSEGRFIERFPNLYAHPVRVSPGRYIDVAQTPSGPRRVQAEVKPDRTTIVRTEDVRQGARVD